MKIVLAQVLLDVVQCREEVVESSSRENRCCIARADSSSRIAARAKRLPARSAARSAKEKPLPPGVASMISLIKPTAMVRSPSLKTVRPALTQKCRDQSLRPTHRDAVTEHLGLANSMQVDLTTGDVRDPLVTEHDSEREDCRAVRHHGIVPSRVLGRDPKELSQGRPETLVPIGDLAFDGKDVASRRPCRTVEVIGDAGRRAPDEEPDDHDYGARQCGPTPSRRRPDPRTHDDAEHPDAKLELDRKAAVVDPHGRDAQARRDEGHGHQAMERPRNGDRIGTDHPEAEQPWCSQHDRRREPRHRLTQGASCP